MKYTRQNLLEIYQGLCSINNSSNVLFNYTLLFNENELSPIIEEIEEFYNNEEVIESKRLLNELNKKCCEKTPNGEPLVMNGQLQILDIKNYEKELKNLQNKNKKVFKKKEEFDNFLLEEIEIEFLTIKINNLLNEKINKKQLKKIFPILRV